ncbi:aminotransferase class IV [Acetobacter conturbans]|uniref:Probable branched-chain-amino-acid aminotransferase n=1 Tax=Acetobacter conturbans TaxID=1737472 RepID=A0ABX0K129_9PROT|nr:aminotransferase class IV [Acetobacter conturbans]NHN88819.1 aminotransferase class IV [Acetobacter conturbans]
MTGKVWLNGTIVSEEEARIAPGDRGFLLGDGLFETMRVAEGQIPHLERHLTRLEDGCATLRLPPPQRSLMQQAVADLAAASRIAHGSMRLTVTRGCGPRGLLPSPDMKPTVLLTCALATQAPLKPVRLGVSRYVRDGSSPLSRVKSLNYLPMVMARMDAVAAGFDDALLPGFRGVVAEASASNILLLLNGELVTPLVEDGALPGTSRARLLEMGLCVERSVSLGQLGAVKAAWLVSALSVQRVAAIDDFLMGEDPLMEHTLRESLFGLNASPE